MAQEKMKLGILHVLTIDRSCQTRKLKSHKQISERLYTSNGFPLENISKIWGERKEVSAEREKRN